MATSLRSRSQPAGNARAAAREILLFGLFGAILVTAQLALSFLPNIELVSLLIIVYALVLRGKVFYPVYIFVLAEGLIFGFGIWWISYLYIWAVLAAAVLLMRKTESAVFWAIVSGVFGLLFGALCSIPYLFIGGAGAAAAYWINGIPFDLLHCVGNAAAAAMLFRPSYKIMKRLYTDKKP